MGLMANLKGQKAYRLQGKNQPAEAKRLYAEAVKEGLNDPRCLLAYSIMMIRDGEYTEARELLVKMQKLPTLSPDQKTQLFVNYAACVYKLGDIDKGIRLLERQFAHQPVGLIYQTLGYLYVEKYAIEHKPDFAALAAQAAEEEAAAQAEEASSAEETAEAQEPAPQEARLSPEEEWQAGIDKAFAFEEAAIDYDDEDAICLDNMGQFLYRVRGDRDGAKAWFDRAIAEKAEQIDTLWFLSRYDLDTDNRAAALEKLETAVGGRFSPLNFASREMVEAEIARLKAE